jgi:hypothetical protein
MSVDKIAEAMRLDQYTAFPVKIFPAAILADDDLKLREVLFWVAEQIRNSSAAVSNKPEKKPAPAKQEDDVRSRPDLFHAAYRIICSLPLVSQILTQWLSVEDEPDDEFLEKFTSYKLENWGHRVHLRIAWVYLSQFPRRVAMKKIFDGIKNFIDHSEISHKTKFHETMTYFCTRKDAVPFFPLPFLMPLSLQGSIWCTTQ